MRECLSWFLCCAGRRVCCAGCLALSILPSLHNWSGCLGLCVSVPSNVSPVLRLASLLHLRLHLLSACISSAASSDLAVLFVSMSLSPLRSRRRCCICDSCSWSPLSSCGHYSVHCPCRDLPLGPQLPPSCFFFLCGAPQKIKKFENLSPRKRKKKIFVPPEKKNFPGPKKGRN